MQPPLNPSNLNLFEAYTGKRQRLDEEGNKKEIDDDDNDNNENKINYLSQVENNNGIGY